MDDDSNVDSPLSSPPSSPPAASASTKHGARLDRLAECLLNGETLDFTAAGAPEESSLPADWLAETLSSIQSFDTTVFIKKATIKGELKLRYAAFRGEVCLLDSTFEGGIDCSFATFERQADFGGSVFLAPFNCRGATFKRGLALSLSQFAGDAAFEFEDARVEGILRAEGARFGAASFRRARLTSALLFGPHARDGQQAETSFGGDADFTDARIEGPLYFDGAQFGGSLSFRRARINSAAFFRAFTDATEAPTGELQSPPASPPCEPAFTLSPPSSPPDAPVATRPVAAYFGGRVDFNHAEINGIISFNGAKFCRQLDFVRACLKNSLIFNTYIHETTGEVFRTTFHGEVDFAAAHVAGGAAFMGACFRQQASFERIRVGGNLLFKGMSHNGKIIITEFDSAVTFLGGYVDHNAEFDGARFKGKATFDRIEVGNNAYFRPAYDRWPNPSLTTRSRFCGVADFVGAHIQGDAEFTSACFEAAARFEGFHVEGNTFFNDRFEFPESNLSVEPVRFDGKADFTSAHFERLAKFYNAHFGGRSLFPSADFDGAAIFKGARFEKQIDFTGSYFKQSADFRDAMFFGLTDFTSANVDGAVFFKKATLCGPTSFRAARFQSLGFDIRDAVTASPPATNFGSDLDLKGFTYDLIDINADILGPMLKSMKEYNRQPYTQLERVLRLTGQDELADKTYLTQREKERKLKKEKPRWRDESTKAWTPLDWIGNKASLLFDTIQKWVGNYGVQPFLRLFVISCVVIALGTCVFNGRGAVVPKESDKEFVARREDEEGRRVILPVEPEDRVKLAITAPTPVQLPRSQAFAVSLNQFIPIVQIPSGSKWKPSQNPLPNPFTAHAIHPSISYAFYGTIHSILGVILVPLGVAALTGVLHRQEKPGK